MQANSCITVELDTTLHTAGSEQIWDEEQCAGVELGFYLRLCLCLWALYISLLNVVGLVTCPCPCLGYH